MPNNIANFSKGRYASERNRLAKIYLLTGNVKYEKEK